MDYDRFWSAEARRFTTASLAGLVHRFAGVEGVVSLAGGLPPAEAFPLTELRGSTREGQQVVLGAEGQQAYLAQQYNFNPQGFTPLLDWLRALTRSHHGVPVAGPAPPPQQASSTPPPPLEGASGDQPAADAGAADAAVDRSVPPPLPPLPLRDLVLTCGAIHAICAAIACLTDPGDTLMVDEYTYTHALECVFLPRDLRMLPVRGDSEGMDPDHLHAQLQAAAAAADAGTCRRPRLLYTIPTGHNPTGTVMSEDRKRRILQVCAAHDLLVLEDDAYYWLHFPAGPAPPEQQPGLAGLARSMLSMDTAGRVVRIDTFSKLLGPGYRLGWITAPQPLVSKLSNWVMASTVGPCSVTQVLVCRMLQQWGMGGFAAFLQRLQALYATRAAAAHEAAVAHLGELAEFRPVRAGMFMWITLKGVPDVAAVLGDLVAARVVVVPGSMFATRGLQNTVALDEPQSAVEGGAPAAAAADSVGALSPCFRLSFAGSPPEVLAEGMRRLAEATRAVLARGRGGGSGGCVSVAAEQA